MSTLVDLSDVAGLERAWAELERVRRLRDADPELRAVIVHRCEQLDPAESAPILAALDQVHPEAVLEAHFRALAPRRRTIGAVRRELPPAQPLGPRPAPRPATVTRVVVGMVSQGGFSIEVAARAAFEDAVGCGLEPDEAGLAITAAVRHLRGGDR